MAIKNQLFWRKYRPKTLSSMVILPRIKRIIENGIQQDLIFHGHPGTGKSTLVEILLKDKHFMKINASMENGIDTLREKIMDFCETLPSPFVKTTDKIKYVYLEEFDKVTNAFQDGFKAFVEKYDDRVRFIISMNDITNVIPALSSRFTKICFNPSNDEEKSYLMTGYTKYLLSVAKHSKIDISEGAITGIMSKNFPDLRASVQDLQTIFITGNPDTMASGNYSDVLSFILNGQNNLSDNFYFVMDNWVNQPKDLIDVLGRPLYYHLLRNNPEIIKTKGLKLLDITKQYNAEFEITTDPPLHVVSLICELKKILNE
jgi:replication-associated recombination protein RarA